MEKSLYTEWFLRVKYNGDDFFYLGRVSEFEEVKSFLDKLKELHEIKNGESRSIEENLRTMYDTIRRESRFFKPRRIFPFGNKFAKPEEVKTLLGESKELHKTIGRISEYIRPEDVPIMVTDIVTAHESYSIVPHHLYTATLEGIEAERFMKREHTGGSGVVSYFSSKFGLPENITRFVFILGDHERKNFIEGLEKKAEELYLLDEAVKNGRHYRI